MRLVTPPLTMLTIIACYCESKKRRAAAAVPRLVVYDFEKCLGSVYLNGVLQLLFHATAGAPPRCEISLSTLSRATYDAVTRPPRCLQSLYVTGTSLDGILLQFGKNAVQSLVFGSRAACPFPWIAAEYDPPHEMLRVLGASGSAEAPFEIWCYDVGAALREPGADRCPETPLCPRLFTRDRSFLSICNVPCTGVLQAGDARYVLIPSCWKLESKFH